MLIVPVVLTPFQVLPLYEEKLAAAAPEVTVIDPHSKFAFA